jgi:hypothetical protein
MKRLFLVLVFITGCTQQTPTTWAPEHPVVNLPAVLRQANWLGNKGQGSCVWASTISLLRWQGRPKTADYIRRMYGDGEYPDSFEQQVNALGIRYAMTTDGDIEFLEWAIRTRRGAAVTVKGGAHMVCLVDLDAQRACLMDNNSPQKYVWVPRESFLAEWRASHGWALTVVYAPCPPLPH